MDKVRFRGRKYGFPEGIITKIAKAAKVSRPTVYRHLLKDTNRSKLNAEKREILTTMCQMLLDNKSVVASDAPSVAPDIVTPDIVTPETIETSQEMSNDSL